METRRPLPIGIDDFEELRSKGFYYVDKTALITDLLLSPAKVTLLLHPRRFGKTLAQSTIKCFFEDTGSEEGNAARRALFDGLAVTRAPEAVTSRMASAPVVSVTFKDGKGGSLESSIALLCMQIASEFERHKGIADRLDADDRERYERLRRTASDNGVFADALRAGASYDIYDSSLAFLTACIHKATGAEAILLIDEYDVPLDGAYFGGYYDEMVAFIRTLLSTSMKGNAALDFAVVTGCLRISKESIFTGINNLRVATVAGGRFSEHFGFLQDEVDAMVAHFGHGVRGEDIKRWYDGYVIGEQDVYNPWSVINCLDELNFKQDALLLSYWANTSSNDIVRLMVDRASDEEREQLEQLARGGTVEALAGVEVTYRDLDENRSSIWAFLLYTGYLTVAGSRQTDEGGLLSLRIPNLEVRGIFTEMVRRSLDMRLRAFDREALIAALFAGDAARAQAMINNVLIDSISVQDWQEGFYHGLMVGLLQSAKGSRLASNRESGSGRPDLLLRTRDFPGPAAAIEVKVAGQGQSAEDAARAALGQAVELHYTAEPEAESFSPVYCYGLGFKGKQCCLLLAD